jgi:three-Cys-motif partner protein
MTPENFFEDLAAHSRAKHDILRRYLRAWYPIMSNFAKKSGNNVIRYIDGFAGEGTYENGGYYGSPLIALNVIKENEYLINKGLIYEYLFFEETDKGFRHLQEVLSSISFPNCMQVKLECGKFETKLTEWLDLQNSLRYSLDPTFIFVDPFGPTGFSMNLMRRLLSYRSTEVLVTLNLQSIIRWYLEDEEKFVTLDSLFGCRDWRDWRIFSDPIQKVEFLRNLYSNQLKVSNDILTRDFRMENKKGLTSYYLVYATHDPKGLDVMKTAMWSVDPTGAFQYSDITNPAQPLLFRFDEMDCEKYGRELAARFAGMTVPKLTLEEVRKTDPYYLAKHLTGALKWLVEEADPKIIAHGKKRGTGWSSDTEFIFPSKD